MNSPDLTISGLEDQIASLRDRLTTTKDTSVHVQAEIEREIDNLTVQLEEALSNFDALR